MIEKQEHVTAEHTKNGSAQLLSSAALILSINDIV